MTNYHRPELNTIPPAAHGAFDYAELAALGHQPEAVLDFSVNSNPFGPSPAVRRALAETPPDRYPDREAIALRQALAARFGLPAENIVAGNGTAELFWLLAFATLRPGDSVYLIEPTFGEYRRVAGLMGARVHSHRAQPDAFAPDAAAIATDLRRLRPRLAFVCNPNNPTGVLLPPAQIAEWAQAAPETLLVVDESYLGFTPEGESALGLGADNVLVVRSLTKDYALAGLRLGFAAGHNLPLVRAIAAVRPAWNVSGPAQAAGLAALADDAYLQECLTRLHRAKSQLVAGLRKLGYAPLESAVHYFLLRVGHADAFRRALLRHGLQVRDCASFGLPEFVRLAPRTEAENRRLLETLREWQMANSK
ncbi:MAG: histidinol-phosphate transaminase [Anaerolineae bacterium]